MRHSDQPRNPLVAPNGAAPLPSAPVRGTAVAADKPLQTAGFVYFIQCNHGAGPVKIGVAKNIWKRLESLQGGCPYELDVIGFIPTDDPRALEGILHSQFGHRRIRGEWFEWCQELDDYICEVTNRLIAEAA